MLKILVIHILFCLQEIDNRKESIAWWPFQRYRQKMTAQRIIHSWQFWRRGIHTVRCKNRCNFWLHMWRKIQSFCQQSSANLHCIDDWANLLNGLPFTGWCAFYPMLILQCSRCLSLFRCWCLGPWPLACFTYSLAFYKFQIIIFKFYFDIQLINYDFS